jgi:hypothetical protein
VSRRRAGLIVVALAIGAAAIIALIPRPSPRVSFERDVQPIFTRSCAGCHPASFPYLDLREGHAWDELVRIPSATNPAFERVLPRRPDLSYLLTHPPDPSNAKLLTRSDRRIIAAWIREGAPRN